MHFFVRGEFREKRRLISTPGMHKYTRYDVTSLSLHIIVPFLHVPEVHI